MSVVIDTKGRVFLILFVVVAVLLGFRFAMSRGIIGTPGILKSLVPERIELPTQTDAKVSNVTAAPFPTSSAASVSSVPFPVEIWEWNAYFAPLLANGGITPTKGSYMEKFNVNLHLKREDSNDQMKKDVMKCADELHSGEKTCVVGAAALIIMGDGAGASWMADLNPQLAKYGPEYQLEIVGAVGRSNGEDALLGKAEWITDPQSMKGATLVGVIGDGDWDIAMKRIGDFGLKNNPDLTTYDPDAVNWIAAPENDYIKAVTMVYVPNRCEQRKEMKDGKLTGKSVTVCPDGVVTWFPGDKLAVEGRPGTVKVVSSRDYSSQMPATMIGIKKFFNDNRDEVSGFFAASFLAADQIKAFDSAVKKAGQISADVYHDTEYDWAAYYPGKMQGNVLLGGSAVFNMEDNVNYFNLDGKHNNTMKSVYSFFADIAASQNPNFYGKGKAPIPAYKDVVDTSFLMGAQSLLSNGGATEAAADTVNYAQQAAGGVTKGDAPVYIEFATGDSTPLPSSAATLQHLKDQLVIGSMAIKLDGYTDNTGIADKNLTLSKARANAVKTYLQRVAPNEFPDQRFISVEGHGQENPIGDNSTVSGKAANRRVEVTQIGR
jgi:OmpA-OmpF porin, OOP family